MIHPGTAGQESIFVWRTWIGQGRTGAGGGVPDRHRPAKPEPGSGSRLITQVPLGQKAAGVGFSVFLGVCQSVPG